MKRKLVEPGIAISCVLALGVWLVHSVPFAKG